MPTELPDRARRLISLVGEDRFVHLYLEDVEVPRPEEGEVILRVEAAPINPSDLGLLFAGADLTRAEAGGTTDRPTVRAPIAEAAMPFLGGRVGVAMPVGNEGAGVVVAAGSSPAAQSLLGRRVAVAGGAMYADYRRADAKTCLALPEHATATEGASSFVNPMTALGMVETMRAEDHRALVHTAAASNLGQMLHRLCAEEEVPLVNVVRRPDQELLLRSAGAAYVCDSSSANFAAELVDALLATSATLAFDAVGGGELAGQLLSGMEAASSGDGEYSRYGSTTYKQVYIYGGLDRRPTVLNRSYGMAWGVGGWLLPNFLQRMGPVVAGRMRQRVAAGLRTTFASSYSDEVTLAGALDPAAIAAYGRQATGRKYLIVA